MEYLIGEGCAVFGFDLAQMPPFETPTHATYYSGDLCDKGTAENLISSSRPDIVYHFAGILRSENPIDVYHSNVTGTVTLLEAIQKQALKPKILIASSSAVYGDTSSKKPITERSNVQPVTHYGASKAAQELGARQYFLSSQMPILFARTFNLIGPGQPLGLACSDFAHQIAMAEMGRSMRTVVTGELHTKRDFIDVRDAVHAYTLIVKLGTPGLAYNVCSGKYASIGECLRILIKMAKVPLTTTQDVTRVHKDDVPFQVGSPARLRRLTGWKPKLPLRRSLEDLLDYWRGKVMSPE
jgi:GDP-4-dehydro-6-deoxy-D-mannose reductase